MSNLIKRQPVPAGVTLPKHYAYVGMGSEELVVSEAGKAKAFLGSHFGVDWFSGCTGREEAFHYALPLDSEFLEPEAKETESPKEFTLRLPDGFPPLPEDGLEDMGMDPRMEPGTHDGYYSARKGDDHWTFCGAGTYRLGEICTDVRVLRRPPVQPQPVPFDSIKDFGDTFPIYVHSSLEHSMPVQGYFDNRIRFDDTTHPLASLQDSKTYRWRWSTSPLTPWEDCKPFTKEARMSESKHTPDQ